MLKIILKHALLSVFLNRTYMCVEEVCFLLVRELERKINKKAFDAIGM